MRIAFCTDTYEPQINGVVSSINRFAGKLQQQGNSVIIYCPKAPQQQKRTSLVTVPSVALYSYPGYRIGIPTSIPASLKRTDIIHVHSPFSLGLLGIAAARRYKKPVVGTFHTLLPEFTDYFIKTQFLKGALQKTTWKYLQWFYNLCDHVIAPSPEIRDILKKQGIRKPITVVPTGVERPGIIDKQAARKKHGFSSHDKVLLHVGRMSAEKNIPFLVKTLDKLIKSSPTMKFVIASDGPEKKKIEQLVKTQKTPRVYFPGFLGSKELDEYYALADVLVVASRSETQGLVVAEAAMRKLPIVALNDPVLGNFVKRTKTGIVASRKNFAQTVKKMLSHPRAIVPPKEYLIEKTTQNLLNVYHSLTSTPAGIYGEQNKGT